MSESKLTHLTQSDTACNTNIKGCELRSRNWCFTWNNYDHSSIDYIRRLDCGHLFQEEVGESGTPHLQGVLGFVNARTFLAVKKLLPKAHIEVCKNLVASCRYCCKKESRCGKIYCNVPKWRVFIDKNDNCDTNDTCVSDKNIEGNILCKRKIDVELLKEQCLNIIEFWSGRVDAEKMMDVKNNISIFFEYMRSTILDN